MQPPPIPHQRRGPSRTAIGCGVVAALFVLAVVALIVWWVLRPRVGLDVAAVAGPDAVVVLHLRDLRRDPGTMQLLRQVQDLQTDAFREQLERDMPSGMQGIGRLMAGMQSMNRFSSGSIPEVIAALEPGQGTNLVEVVAAARVGGIARLMVGLMTSTLGKASGGAVHSYTYRGRKIMDLGGEAFLSFSRGTMLFATHQASMQTMIDRFMDGAMAPPLMRYLPSPEGAAWDLVVVGENQRRLFAQLETLLKSFVEAFPDEDETWDDVPSFADVEGGWIGLDIHTGDWVRARLRLACTDEAGAASVGQRWKTWLEPRIERLRTGAFEPMLTVKQDGTEVHVDLDVTNVERAMREGFRKWMDKSTQPPAGAETQQGPGAHGQ